MQSEPSESLQMTVGAAGYLTRGIDVLDAHEPRAVFLVGTQVAGYRREDGAEVERAGG